MKIIYACNNFDHIEYAQVCAIKVLPEVSSVCVVSCTSSFTNELAQANRVEIIPELNKKRFYKKAQVQFETVVEDYLPDVVYTVHGNSLITNVIAVLNQPKFSHVAKISYRGVIGNLNRFCNPESLFTHNHKRVDACMGTSRAVVDYLKSQPGMKSKIIDTLSPGISLDFLKAKAAKTSLLEQFNCTAKIKLGFLGSMTRKIKGFDILAKSITSLPPEKQKQIQLFCIGDPPKNYARLSSVSSFKFLGFDTNPWRHFKYLDYLVMPSRLEGFGRAGLEAFNLRLPIVTSGVGGIQEYVRHNKNGLIVENNSAAYKSLWLDMLEDSNYRDKQFGLAQEAFQTSLQYSPERSAKVLLKNFKNAVDKRRSKLSES